MPGLKLMSPEDLFVKEWDVRRPVQKLHVLARTGMGLKAIAKAMMRSEESIQARAKLDKIKLAKLR